MRLLLLGVHQSQALPESTGLGIHAKYCLLVTLALSAFFLTAESWGQSPPGTTNSIPGLRPSSGSLPSTDGNVMVPLNPTRSMGFDPYASASSSLTGFGSLSGLLAPQTATSVPSYSTLQPPAAPLGSSVPFNSGVGGSYPAAIAPGAYGPGSGLPGNVPFNSYPNSTYPNSPFPAQAPGVPLGGMGWGSYPSYNGPQPILPGAGQSAIVQTNPALLPNNYSSPGIYPNSTPSALFPGGFGNNNSGWLGNMFGSNNPGFGAAGNSWGGNNWSGNGWGTGAGNNWPGGGINWNPQGTIFNGQYGQPPGFIQLFHGPRIRHSYIHRGNRYNDLGINDTDVAIAMLLPNFAFSNQPIYILPSFSLHQWAGPITQPPESTADLPSKAYSAFLDAGWQSDPARILGAELGARVGVFSDFNTLTSRSLRVMGRGIGRIRLTPTATLKLGVLYLDRNRVKLLPAGGLLWQPNPATRLDMFFPEPKLSAYLTTIGNFDTWWYVAGYYGGGAWTIERTDGSKDSIDINDIRVMLGLEWGRNDMMRDGRRVGFAEFGYVFDRELLYKSRPADNLRLQDSFVVRIGLGY